MLAGVGKVTDMNERVKLNYLLDFYGPLLTDHRRELLGLYCEEDLSLQEIADQMAITRQGVSDAVNKARRQLDDYERKLGLVARYQALIEEARSGLEALNAVSDAGESIPAIEIAKRALDNILQIER